MSQVQLKEKMKKSDFETKVIKLGGKLGLGVHAERQGDITLYYMNNGHAASWQKGTGWIFTEKDILANIESAKHMDRLMAKMNKEGK